MPRRLFRATTCDRVAIYRKLSEVVMLTLSDLVANRSVSPDGARLLEAIGAGGHSFLVYARPRNAGKTTLVQAILAAAPASPPQTDFLGTEQEVESLLAAETRGYVQV